MRRRGFLKSIVGLFTTALGWRLAAADSVVDRGTYRFAGSGPVVKYSQQSAWLFKIRDYLAVTRNGITPVSFSCRVCGNKRYRCITWHVELANGSTPWTVQEVFSAAWKRSGVPAIVGYGIIEDQSGRQRIVFAGPTWAIAKWRKCKEWPEPMNAATADIGESDIPGVFVLQCCFPEELLA